ncbi:uncharacterized protein [Procambarus clarkii]|uniref:uncharacterized protein n=1 Tax=Procambarus clarkii TaxID=6728 RepID=UPI00374377A0
MSFDPNESLEAMSLCLNAAVDVISLGLNEALDVFSMPLNAVLNFVSLEINAAFQGVYLGLNIILDVVFKTSNHFPVSSRRQPTVYGFASILASQQRGIGRSFSQCVRRAGTVTNSYSSLPHVPEHLPLLSFTHAPQIYAQSPSTLLISHSSASTLICRSCPSLSGPQDQSSAMVIPGILVMFLLTQVIFGAHVYWNSTGLNIRYVNPSKVIGSVRRMSIVQCAASCSQNTLCVSFNYYDWDTSCELMSYNPYLANDPSLVSSPGWNHYTVQLPVQKLDASLCPAGSVVLPFDLPAYVKYTSSMQLYTCSNHSWILQQIKNSKTCRLVLMYNTEYAGYDCANFPGGTLGFFPSLLQCLKYSCAGMVCRDPNACWLKASTHIIQSNSPSTSTYIYWYTKCQ